MSSHSIEVINAHPSTRLKRAIIVDAVRRVFVGEAIAADASTSVILMSDPALHEINRAHLGHDYPTDVITFRLEDDPLEGEIYISIDRARAQAEEYGVRLYDEVLRLATHGALHLAGHDDATPEQREAMRRLEDHYLGGN